MTAGRRPAVRALLALALLAPLAACDRLADRAADRERANGLYRAAMADYTAGRVDRAVDGFAKVARSDPGNASARFQLACLLQDHRRDYLGAICNYREYVQLAPDSDKAAIARERSEMCERMLAPELARRMNLAGNAELAAENERLRKENAALAEKERDLAAKLERAVARGEEYARESERLRKLAPSAGEESTARPVVEVSEKVLLDDDEGMAPSDVASDIRALRAEERDELAGGTPFKPTARPADRPAKAEPAAAARPATYVVQEGDTLIQIAQRFYGVKSAWKTIRDANKATISTDGRVRAGMTIVLP